MPSATQEHLISGVSTTAQYRLWPLGECVTCIVVVYVHGRQQAVKKWKYYFEVYVYICASHIRLVYHPSPSVN